jgi:chaperonin cofactor prefoldin
MAFAVEEFHDLVRLLEQHPEWRAELRRLVLSEELLSLPDLVRELAQAQRRTEERLEAVAARVEQLAEAQRRTEERLEAVAARVEQLAEAQRRTEERLEAVAARVEQLAVQVDRLAEAQRRTEERLEAVAARVEQLAVQVDRLAEAQRRTEERLDRITDRLAATVGSDLERRYRERAASYFQGLLRRIRVVDHQALGLKLDEAQDAGLITRQERDEILRLDVVVQGRLDAEEVYLAVEVSGTVDEIDVRRAAERAKLLEKATGQRVIPAVAGNEFTSNTAEEATRYNVACFLDGRLVGAA